MSTDLGMRHALSSAISTWINGHQSRSISVLEQKCSVPYSTLSRILQCEGEPRLETIFKILNVVCSAKETYTFLIKYFPEIGERFSIASEVDNSNQQHPDISNLLKDKDFFVIITIASARDTTREEIHSLLGSTANNAIDTLLSLDVIREINGKIIAGESCKKFTVINTDTLLAESSIIAKIFNKDRLGKPGSMIGIKTDSVDLDSLKRIEKILRVAFKEVHEIAEKSSGPYVFSLSIILNLIGDVKLI